MRALEAARAEAEARAAAHAAEAEVVRLQVERLQFELATVRDELARRVAAAAESADAMLTNAAGELTWLTWLQLWIQRWVQLGHGVRWGAGRSPG